MVEQQELSIDGSGEADDAHKNQFAGSNSVGNNDGGDDGSGVIVVGGRVNANSTLRDAEETMELLRKDGGDGGGPVSADNGNKKTVQIQSGKQQQPIELSPISRGSTKDQTVVPIDDSTVGNDDDEWEMVPPDGGWGWLILAGSMLVNILVPGTVKSFGVLFVEFLEAFDASPATAAWIPALCYFLYSSLGPLSSILSVRYSYRTVTLIGGTFAAVGMMVSYFASSVTYLYISYGLLVGTGAGLSFPPTVYIVTSYFVRLRGLANGICISGSALGSIILPPVLRYLLENYGYRGAVLIMGGITLNTWVAAIFYEPVENHMKRVLKKKPVIVEEDELFADLDDVIEEEDEGIIVQCIGAGDDVGQPAANAGKPRFTITSDEGSQIMGKSIGPYQSPDAFRLPKHGENNGFVRSASAVVVQNFSRSNHDEQRSRKISTPARESGVSGASFAQQLSSTPSLYAVPEGGSRSRVGSHSRLSRLSQLRGGSTLGAGGSIGGGSGTSKPKRSPSTSSFQYVSTPCHGSTLSFQPAEFSSHVSLRSIASSINPVAACSRKKTDGDAEANGDGEKKSPTGMNKFLDLSLLHDPAYLVVLISNSTNAIGYTNFIILLPAYAMALGFDKNYSAYLLSIVSALDLVGRIGGSALSDWTDFIPKTWYFVGGLALSGFSLAAMPQATSYTMVSFWCGLFGLASGTYVGITAVIMADMLGTERLTSTYGISLFVNGILQLVGPPLCGLWLSQVHTYVPLFTTLGCVLMAGASLWGFMPFIHRSRRLKEEERVARLAFLDNGGEAGELFA